MSGDDAAAGLDAHSYPLGSTRPDTEQLSPFEANAEDADIVGLGEATHGTRDLFELKGRLVRHLVAECGFRTVAVETDFVNTLALDEYVQQGTGTPADALDDVILWVWKTEAIREIIEWLRAFNEGRPPEDRVRFHGVSLSAPSGPASRLRTYLERIDERPIPEQERLDRLADEEIPDEPAREGFLDSGLVVAETLREYLDEHREEFVARSSRRKWTLARQACRHLEQNCEWNRLRLTTEGFDPEAFEQRDRYMAENVGWCLETDPGDGVVVWAHNTHVKRGSFDMPQEWAGGQTMGEFLAREHESAYRPYATDFAHGDFRAVANVDDPSQREQQTFDATEPPTETTELLLDQVDSPAAFLDITGAAEDPRLSAWFDEDRQLRAAAALVDPDTPEKRRMKTDLAASFDGLFVAEETTPSVPLPTPED
jgi:erythromycin esterase